MISQATGVAEISSDRFATIMEKFVSIAEIVSLLESQIKSLMGDVYFIKYPIEGLGEE